MLNVVRKFVYRPNAVLPSFIKRSSDGIPYIEIMGDRRQLKYDDVITYAGDVALCLESSGPRGYLVGPEDVPHLVTQFRDIAFQLVSYGLYCLNTDFSDTENFNIIKENLVKILKTGLDLDRSEGQIIPLD